ncbi:MAG: NAD(+)/NADH kinase [Deltaproteobacteria bacterium]|nr:NAD(+)/NADH kinase [Deltaproteobacteria bacterium]
MRIRTVLLATKTTLYERFGVNRREPRIQEMIAARNPFVGKVQASHFETVRSRDVVREVLGRAGLRVREARRHARVPDGRYDLVVVVGGDGTVLDFAQNVRSTPMLAVNSSPSSSVGHFCAVNADTFGAALDAIAADRIAPTALTRVRVAIDGADQPKYVLNDVLFAHTMPAATSRYVIEAGGVAEEQKSSGVWVSTAAGSTGAIRSASGTLMDTRDERLQYVVREPYYLFGSGTVYRLLGGFVGQTGISFVSRMVRGGVYLDGRRAYLRAGYSTRVTLTPDAPKLNLVLPRWRR